MCYSGRMTAEELNKLRELHTKYIQGTSRKAAVKYERVLVEYLSKMSLEGVAEQWPEYVAEKVYLSTHALKHIFDSRAAQEYDAILSNLPAVITQPGEIYENLDGKRGELALVKGFRVTAHDGETWEEAFFCSLQVVDGELEIATVFRFGSERKKKNYLTKYKLLWNWEGD